MRFDVRRGEAKRVAPIQNDRLHTPAARPRVAAGGDRLLLLELVLVLLLV
jgi:hypothetical protein